MIKTLKVSIFYYLACHGNEWVCSKKKKLGFGRQKRDTTQQQTKKNQEKNQLKNGNNSTYHEPLSEEWIGRRS